MKFLQNKIESKQDIANYITNLFDNNMMYHFDDEAEDILSYSSGFEASAFTNDQCKLLNTRRDEMFEIDYDYAFECAFVRQTINN
jgi:hypothetical protein